MLARDERFSGKDVEIKKNIKPIWPAMAPDHNWDGGLTSISQFGGEQRVRIIPPWFLFIPSANEWRNKPIDISQFGSEGRTGLTILRPYFGELEVVLKKLGGYADIYSIWEGVVAHQSYRELTVRDVAAGLEKMSTVKKYYRYRLIHHCKLRRKAQKKNQG